MEVPVQKIRSDLTNFILVGTVFLHFDTANQFQLFHKPLDSLVIQKNIALSKFYCNTTIAKPAFAFVVDSLDCCLGSFILV